MKRFLGILILFLACFIIACDQQGNENLEPKLTLSNQDAILKVGEELEVSYQIENLVDGLNVLISSESEFVSIDGKTIKALAAGEATIKVYFEGKEDLALSFKVTVENITVETIVITGDTELIVGTKGQVSAEVLPAEAFMKEIEWSSSNPEVLEVSETGEVTAKAVGTAKIIATAKDGSNVYGELEIEVVKDKVKPVISIDEKIILQDCTISYNEKFDPLKGITALDNIDGDITDKIQIDGEVNNRKVGKYTLEYVVKDSQGNRSDKLYRLVTVVWDYAVSFIGHAGCYSGLMNSEEAFQNAFRVHGYQGIECDVKQTKDGVFVMSHDDTFAGYTLANTNYADLKDVVYTATRGGISYSTKICTLERYLQICKNNNGYAVIELKSSKGITNSDQSRMQALMDVIEACGMLNNVVFLGSQYNCLAWTRSHGYEYIPCQYLVNSCESETFLNRCIENNFDISFNVSYSNSQEWIDRYHDAGLKVACYTFSQYTDANDLQEWIDKGVDYVTVDVTKPYEVTLPKASDKENLEKFDVTFKDYDGSVLKVSSTVKGKKATTPVDPQRLGYKFIGWDKDITNVTEAMEVVAQYEIETYTITYKANTTAYSEVAWESKEAFLTELYTDWFNWLDANVGKISGLTKEGNTYKLSMNGKSPTWTDVASLRALDLYDVEKTIGCLAYKPVENRASATTPVDPVEDNGYFLNTEPYRTKYANMDAYLINCIATSYTSYSYNYNQSSGRVQIFFRFHQWAKGTNIPAFDTLPLKVEKGNGIDANVTLPETNLTYTVNDQFQLPVASAEGFNFTGWYTDALCTEKVSEITLGTTGNIVLYAGWKESE